MLPLAAFAPSTPSSNAHLNLAQLCAEDDPRGALQHYQSAVDVLLGQLNGKERAVPSKEGEDGESEIRAKVVSALAAMVEIWMSDLW